MATLEAAQHLVADIDTQIKVLNTEVEQLQVKMNVQPNPEAGCLIQLRSGMESALNQMEQGTVEPDVVNQCRAAMAALSANVGFST